MGQLKLFLSIWMEREHRSFISEITLRLRPGNNFWFNYFAHVIPKGLYPSFKLNKENIVFLTPEEHNLYDFGTEDQRKKYVKKMAEKNINVNWEKLYQLRDRLKKKYNELYL